MKSNPVMKLPLAPAAKLIGFKITRIKKGAVICMMKAMKKHENTNGTVHGGILCDLSDAAMGYSFLTWLAPEETGVTVEFKINFLKPVLTGDVLWASAKTLSRGKSLFYLECEIRNTRKELVAKAASTCKVTGRIAGSSF